jgi:hypothetical protein
MGETHSVEQRDMEVAPGPPVKHGLRSAAGLAGQRAEHDSKASGARVERRGESKSIRGIVPSIINRSLVKGIPLTLQPEGLLTPVGSLRRRPRVTWARRAEQCGLNAYEGGATQSLGL